MWPFGHEDVAQRLAQIPPGKAGAVAVRVTVISENVVTSPLTRLASAFLQIDLLERIAAERAGIQDGSLNDEYFVLGSAKHGQVLRLRDPDGDEVSVVAGRVRFEPSTTQGGQPVTDVPPGLAPYLRNATGRGILCMREHALREGDTVLLRAVVEPSLRVVPEGYRSGTSVHYLTRDDLAPVVLVEVVDVPEW
jgi:hypothetical protein